MPALMFFQSPVSQAVERMIELHDYIFFFLVLIFSFVLWFFFNILSDFSDFDHELHVTDLLEKENSYSKTYNLTHLGAIEVIWTIIPVLILTAIAIPSFQLLYALDVVSQPLLTLKCIGNQWYWSYECYYSAQYFERDVKNSILIVNDKHNFFNYQQSLNDNENMITAYLVRENKEKIAVAVEEARKVKSKYSPEFRNVDLPPHILYLRDYTDSLYALYDYLQDQVFSLRRENPQKGESLALSVMLFTNEDLVDMIDDTEFPVREYFNNWLKKIKAEIPISFKFDSFMIDVDELSLGQFRLLEVDNFPILPAHCEIRLIITSLDVLHSFALPALGVKLDAIPGRLNQFGIKVRVPGTYFGQCSELCGAGHGFMPIKISFVNTLE